MASNIIGLDNLLKRLDKLAGNAAVMKGIEKACLRVEATAKENCPVDTGLLRASIDHKLDVTKLEGIVGTNLEYAAAVEFGSIKKGAQPYLYPALASNVDKIKADIIEAVRNEIGGH